MFRLDRVAVQELQSGHLGWEADGIPVWRRKLQFPSEDLIKQLLLHIVFTGGKFTVLALTTSSSSLLLLLPPKWREPAQQDVGDHSRGPDVHLQTIPAHTTTHSG